MNRPTTLLVIAIVLAVYGVYTAAYVPPMLLGRPEPLLVIGFVVQAVLAIAAAIGVWRGFAWAPLALVLLGAGIAATWLVEAFVLGIVAWMPALMIAVLALVVCLLLAAYVGGQLRTDSAA